MLKKLKNVNLFLVIMITAFVFGISLKIVFADYLFQSSPDQKGVTLGNIGIKLGNGENLFWGLIKSDSTGSFILLQDSNGSTYTDKFKLDHSGNITASGNIEASGLNIAGNVGIRTSVPGYPLHIVDNDGTSILNIDNIGAKLWNGLRLASGGTEKWFAGMNSTDDKFRLRRNGATDDLVIDTNGNVGIGTTNPTSRLSVDGGGITIGGTPQRGNWNSRVPMNNVITTVESEGDVGQYSSMTIGRDGLPVISYIDKTNNRLRVVKCGNAACSAENKFNTIFEDPYGYFTPNFGTSITIGKDGYPLISVYNSIYGSLYIIKCGNDECSSGNTYAEVDDDGGGPANAGGYSSITIGKDGFPVISYYDFKNQDLKFVKCNNEYCTGGNTISTTLDSTNDVGQFTSIAIGKDGFPVISYYYKTGQDLKIVVCGNVSCNPSGNTITTLDAGSGVGEFSSITIGSDGFPVISYYNDGGNTLRVAKCGNNLCNAGNVVSNVDSNGTPGEHTSITIGTDGLPVIAHYVWQGGDIRVVKCGNLACSAGITVSTVDNAGGNGMPVGISTSIAIGPDGLPIISYFDDTNDDLKVVKCGNERCIPYWTRR